MPGDLPGSVLVIQTAFIGDVILVTPLLKAIHDFFPDADIDVMLRPPSDNLVETLPYLRSVIIFDKYGTDRGFKGVKKFAQMIKESNYDLIFLPHRSFRSGFIAYLSGVKNRVGFKRGGGLLFHSKRIPYPDKLHEIQRNLRLLSPFGEVPAPTFPEVVSSAQDIAVVDERLEKVQGSRLIAFAPGSVWMTKRWLEDYYVELGKMCVDADFRVILIGGGQDRILSENVANGLGIECLNLTNEITLRQSVEVLRRCEILISNDSAPTHMGVAAGTKVLTIFGSTVPEFGFAPFGPNGRSLGIELDCRPCTDHGKQSCPKKHLHCLVDIKPEYVFQEITKLLE